MAVKFLKNQSWVYILIICINLVSSTLHNPVQFESKLFSVHHEKTPETETQEREKAQQEMKLKADEEKVQQEQQLEETEGAVQNPSANRVQNSKNSKIF